MPAPTGRAEPEAGNLVGRPGRRRLAVDMHLEAEALGVLVRPQHTDRAVRQRRDDADVVVVDVVRERDRAREGACRARRCSRR